MACSRAWRWFISAGRRSAPAAPSSMSVRAPKLGFAYWIGEGTPRTSFVDMNRVPKDFVLAHIWFNLAAKQELRDDVAKCMTPQQIAEAQKLAAAWKPKTWDELKRQMPR